jgi:hypothetical protein
MESKRNPRREEKKRKEKKRKEKRREESECNRGIQTVFADIFA